MVNPIYPSEVQLNKANISGTEATLLHFVLLQMYLLYLRFKRDAFRFPFMDGDVAHCDSKGVYSFSNF